MCVRDVVTTYPSGTTPGPCQPCLMVTLLTYCVPGISGWISARCVGISYVHAYEQKVIFSCHISCIIKLYWLMGTVKMAGQQSQPYANCSYTVAAVCDCFMIKEISSCQIIIGIYDYNPL